MPFPTTEQWIARAEDLLLVRFPDSLRQRFIRLNGGDFKCADDIWTLHPVQDTSDRKLAKRTASHVGTETAFARGWRGFPASGVAIASNGTGNHLVLLPVKGNSRQLGGTVFFWNHENGDSEPVGELADLL